MEELVSPGQDGSPMEPIGDDFVESAPLSDIDGELGEDITPQAEVVEESFYDGKFKSTAELEAYTKRLEMERDYSQNQGITPEQLTRYGINLDAIPVEERTQVDAFTQRHLGMTLTQAAVELAEGRKLRDENNRLRAEKQVEVQQLELRAAWGENYDVVMAAVKKEYGELPEEERPAYNTVRGALNLGAKHQLNLLTKQAAATPRVPGTKVTEMLRSSTPAKSFSNAKKVYSEEAILAKQESDPAWYARNSNAINKLYAEGRIK